MGKDFEFNGVSLVNKRWNIEYIPEGIPKKRGSNNSIPYADGTRFTKKLYDQRNDILNMWVLPCDANGAFNGRSQLEDNIDYLKALFGISGLVPIRKQMIDGTWRAAHAEVVDGIDFERKGDTDPHRVFSVSLQFPDPFWYSEDQVIKTYIPNSSSYACSLTNAGTAPLRKMQIEFTGPLLNPKLENLTSGVYVKLNGTIPAGNTVIVDTEEFTASDGTTNWINTLIHSGDMSWFTLNAGSNSLKITTDETPSGTVKIKYYPAYF